MHARSVVTLSVALLLASCTSRGPDASERMVDIGTHRLRAVVLGKGVPAIVIDGGIGGGSEEWRRIQERIAGEALVVVYDRAGYGASEAGPLPRDSGTEADELRALLRGLSVARPYVLVGHSLGGLNVQVYAGRYSDDVTGMVLLDPPPEAWLLGEGYPALRVAAEQMTDEWQEVADRGLASADPQERTEAAFFRMLASEHREMFAESSRLAAEIETFGDIPLVVIASGVPNPMFGAVADDYQRYWIEQSRAVAAKSTRGRLLLAEESTHRLHVEAEDLVVAGILSVVAQVRDR